MKTCENCGCRVYALGCVNCNEDAYIDQQERIDVERRQEQLDQAADRIHMRQSADARFGKVEPR
jgi:hypothetical protein